MVDSQIKPVGVDNEKILSAYRELPRERFVPETLKGVSYIDRDLGIGGERYMLAPALHARLIHESRPQPGEVVLDIGGGSGYSAAIWSRLVSTVIALEEDQEILDRAARLWRETESFNIAGVIGPLTAGAPQHQPFDIIFLNGAVSSPPDELIGQLGPNGRLMTVLIEPGERFGNAVRYNKNANGYVSCLRLFYASCPHLCGFFQERGFVF